MLVVDFDLWASDEVSFDIVGGPGSPVCAGQVHTGACCRNVQKIGFLGLFKHLGRGVWTK